MRRILRRPAVEEVTGKSCASIYRAIQAGDFPRPIRLSQNAVGWLEDEVEAWIEDRRRARDEGEGAADGE